MIFQGPIAYIAQICKVHLQYGNSTTKWPFYTFFLVNFPLIYILFSLYMGLENKSMCRGCFKIYNLTNIFENVPQYFLTENIPFLPVLYLNQLLELNTKISVVKGKSRIKFYFPRHPFFSSFNRCIMFRGESIQKIIVKN